MREKLGSWRQAAGTSASTCALKGTEDPRASNCCRWRQTVAGRRGPRNSKAPASKVQVAPKVRMEELRENLRVLQTMHAEGPPSPAPLPFRASRSVRRALLNAPGQFRVTLDYSCGKSDVLKEQPY